MPYTNQAIKECWREILDKFVEHGFSKEDVEFDVLGKGKKKKIIFSKRIYETFLETSRKHREDSAEKFDLNLRLGAELQGDSYIVITNDAADRAIIHWAMYLALNDLDEEFEKRRAEKGRRIKNQRKEIEEGIKAVVDRHPTLGIRGMSVFFGRIKAIKSDRKKYFQVHVDFFNKLRGKGKALYPLAIISNSPKDVVTRFEKEIKSIT